MLDVGIFSVLFDRQFLTAAASAILAFATIVTLGLQFADRNPLGQRLKAVTARRQELRAKHHAALKERASLRGAEPVGFMKATLDRFKLGNMLESEDTRDRLMRAGLRGQAPLVAFMFFRFVMPGVVFLVALFYLFVVTHFAWPTIMKAFPDALDLMLICVESGMSIEAAFGRVASEIGQQSVEMAEELGLTTAELSYLADRRQAFENLAKRCGHSGVKAVATALNQAEKYGTPLGQALRVTAQENRELRMMAAEKKAASLPAKLTVPMILFFLPCFFVVIMGPAIMKIMHLTGHH